MSLAYLTVLLGVLDLLGIAYQDFCTPHVLHQLHGTVTGIVKQNPLIPAAVGYEVVFENNVCYQGEMKNILIATGRAEIKNQKQSIGVHGTCHAG